MMAWDWWHSSAESAKGGWQHLPAKGLEFLEDCYEAEHTLSLDDALDDLDAVCKGNEKGQKGQSILIQMH